MMLALFAMGVGVGSMLAERLLHGEVSARLVPLAALAMAGFAIDLHLASAAVPAAAILADVADVPRPGPEAGASSSTSWASRWPAGSSRVPLYALLQHESEPSHRCARHCRQQHHQRRRHDSGRASAPARSRGRLTMGELFALVRTATIPVALVAAWVVRRSLIKGVMRLRAAAALPRARSRDSSMPRGDAACRHRRQPRVVPRRPAARRISTRRSDLCRRHVHRQDMVGAGRFSRW